MDLAFRGCGHGFNGGSRGHVVFPSKGGALGRHGREQYEAAANEVGVGREAFGDGDGMSWGFLTVFFFRALSVRAISFTLHDNSCLPYSYILCRCCIDFIIRYSIYHHRHNCTWTS